MVRWRDGRMFYSLRSMIWRYLDVDRSRGSTKRFSRSVRAQKIRPKASWPCLLSVWSPSSASTVKRMPYGLHYKVQLWSSWERVSSAMRDVEALRSNTSKNHWNRLRSGSECELSITWRLVKSLIDVWESIWLIRYSFSYHPSASRPSHLTIFVNFKHPEKEIKLQLNYIVFLSWRKENK